MFLESHLLDFKLDTSKNCWRTTAKGAHVMSQKFAVDGFLAGPKQSAKGKKYTGRFVCPDVQWVGSGRVDATLRFPNELNANEIRQLAADAMLRIAMFLNRKGVA